MDETLPRKFGKYTLLRRLAIGGMAEIFLALHRSISGFEKLLVIKRILPEFTEDPDFLRMFLDEARIAASLNHTNIVQIFDVGSVEGRYFIAMEHVHGEDLRSVVRGMKKKSISAFPLEHALQVIGGVCAGLEYAHTRSDLHGNPLGIVHRDISPQNVLVTYAGDVKVVDFGIARASISAADPTEERGQLRGKIPYMSPEQCRGRDLDQRSDVFSVGILLFELTTGRRLFRGSTAFNTLRAIVEEDYPRPSQFRESYPPHLEAIVMKALARDREERYGAARDLRADLEEFVREHRLPASSLALSQFLEEIFGSKIAAQREALAQGKRLADIIAAGEELQRESTSDSIGSSGELLGPPSDAAPAAGPPSGPGPSTAAWVEEKKAHLAKRLAVGLVALVLVAGIGGTIFFFTRPGETTTTPEVRGSIEVVTRPEGAAIVLDGAAVEAQTPHTFEDLRVDRTYQVKLSLEGFRHELREVRLTSSHPRERVSLELRPSGQGILSISTVPSGATLFLDGSRLDATSPATVPDVAPLEEHTLVVKLAGYLDVVQTVTVPPGRPHEIRLELEPAPLADDEAMLVVTSEPPGAVVAIDGVESGEITPLERRLAAGRRVKVGLSMEGYESVVKGVVLRGGKRVTVSVELDEDPRAMRRLRREARRQKRAARSGPAKQPAPSEPTKQPAPPSGAPPPAREETGTGRLYFDAQPFCEVTIDGRSYGPTPLAGVEVPAGRRRVRCSSPPIDVTKTFVIDVPADGVARRRVDLEP